MAFAAYDNACTANLMNEQCCIVMSRIQSRNHKGTSDAVCKTDLGFQEAQGELHIEDQPNPVTFSG
jgi:hypothetical protein